MKYSKEVHDFWEKVKQEKVIEADFTDAWGFGDNPALKQELLDLILEGKKRTTTNLILESELEGYPPSRVGQYHVILDGEDKPTAIIRTVQLTLGTLDKVTEEHAYWEGEEDRTRESYIREHVKYYTRVGKRLGFKFHMGLELEFERFELIYP